MTARELIRHFPRLFHMTNVESWPTVQRLGLLSVTALLDLFETEEDRRFRLESEHRSKSEPLRHPLYGDVVLRDQAPLSVVKLAQCLKDMTVTEWLRLLNRKVFFWPTEERVNELLGARLYRDRPQLILVIDTASLLAAREPSITLAPINTGATLYNPQPRGSDTLLPIAQYPFEYWRSKRTPRKAIAELAVDYAVPDILSHVVRVERRQHGLPKEIVLTTEPDERRRRSSQPDPNAVAINRTVRVLDKQSGTLHTWTIVRPERRDAASGRLSVDSPIAKALLDHKPGEIVSAETPRGRREFEIKELVA